MSLAPAGQRAALPRARSAPPAASPGQGGTVTNTQRRRALSEAYPVCRALLGPERWAALLDALPHAAEPQGLPDLVAAHAGEPDMPPWLPDLVRAERTRCLVESDEPTWPDAADAFEINPTLELLHSQWHLAPAFAPDAGTAPSEPQPEAAWILLWREAPEGRTRVEIAANEDLLALKMVAEGLSPEQVVAVGPASPAAVDAVLVRAARKGLLIAPRSKLCRDVSAFPLGEQTPGELVTAHTFTLQWHVTQRCDLHCKHCYDRSKRSPLTLEQGLSILADLHSFCRKRHVRGHVCFTGGNPLMYRHFFELYEAAGRRGFATSLLGNPAPREQIERVLAIRRPRCYQVSLEGLREQNDAMRGPGHFERTIEFLGVLRELHVRSAVMLTLTRENVDDVLPLAELLREKADHFTFNRLSPVGEGADLLPPTREQYVAFLEDYVDAARSNPIIGFKDNLLSIVLRRRGMELQDGCTGFGCGAAFNFLAVLPDGEAHACRKFPSLIGNVLEERLGDIYDSEAAQRYRRGPSACRGCELRAVCGGCLAATRGCGLDIFVDRDPFCFLADAPRASAARSTMPVHGL